jgi:uncharacterized coiled-coil protein SlyX
MEMKMNENLQLDVEKVIASLTTQIAQQAQRIAILEATVDALNNALDSKED